ncbi:MAG: 50S ribosomal protein L30 [SAR202 cluster bacterium]|nr:50S ribosomal protein L30 [SAR202 cluster bacterium]
MPEAKFRVTWKRSTVDKPRDQQETVRSLGLRRLNQTVEVPDTPAYRGMIHKVRHLVEVALVKGEGGA